MCEGTVNGLKGNGRLRIIDGSLKKPGERLKKRQSRNQQMDVVKARLVCSFRELERCTEFR